MFGLVTNQSLNRAIDHLLEELEEFADDMNKKLSGIAAAQVAQSAKISALIKQGSQIMSSLDDDTAAVAAQTTVVASLGTFVQGLQAQISALPGLTAAQQASIDGIFTAVTANNAAIAAAMVVNTPIAPTPAAATAAVS